MKARKFWVYVYLAKRPDYYRIGLWPFRDPKKPTTREPMVFLSLFKTEEKATIEAEWLFGRLSWKRQKDTQKRAGVKLSATAL